MLKFISKHLKEKINNIIETPNSEIEKAWKEYSKDKMFDDPCEEFRVERAFKPGIFSKGLKYLENKNNRGTGKD